MNAFPSFDDSSRLPGDASAERWNILLGNSISVEICIDLKIVHADA